MEGRAVWGSERGSNYDKSVPVEVEGGVYSIPRQHAAITMVRQSDALHTSIQQSTAREVDRLTSEKVSDHETHKDYFLFPPSCNLND